MKLALIVVVVTIVAGPARAAVSKPPPGFDPDVFAKLLDRAGKTNSDAIVIAKDGKIVFSSTFGKPAGPIEAMSATKSIVNLGVGKLIDDHKIKSLDEPVFDFYPEWKQGKKQLITIRHLLNHTSGLQNEKSTAVDIYPSPDFVKLALAAELTNDPGARFAYNNKAVNLLAGIVAIAAGEPMDRYVAEQIFAPLEITEFTWDRDGAGNPQAMAGLHITATDLVKIGQMLLDGGVFHGKRVISKAWIDVSTRPGQQLMPKCGLLWWLQADFRSVVADDALIAEWRKGGDSEAFIAKVMPLKDKVFTDRKAFFGALEVAFGGKPGLEDWYDNTWRKGLRDGRSLSTTTTGFYADGYLGQYLVVIPGQHLVAVRQMRAPEGDIDEAKLDTFNEFPELVRQLVKR